MKEKNNCENCKWKQWSEKNPDKFFAKVWKWHTKWCPGWKEYQKKLKNK